MKKETLEKLDELSGQEKQELIANREYKNKLQLFAKELQDIMLKYDGTIIIDPNSTFSKPSLIPVLNK